MMSLQSTQRFIGIDLGTTNSSVCYTSFNPGRQQFDDPTPARFGDTKTLRSLLLLDASGEKVVASGADVYSHPDYPRYPERVHEEFKLRLGKEPVGEHCTYLMAQELMHGLQEVLSARYLTEEVCQTTVGAPAEWLRSDPERAELVRQAVSRASYPNVQIVAEPVAAMLYHAFLGDIFFADRPQRWLVIDIGGGTTDLALVQTDEGGTQPTILNTFGQNYGGKDFDRLLLEKFLLPRYWSGSDPTPAQRIELLRFIREFKEEFADQVSQDKPGYSKAYRRLPQLRNPVELTYEAFESGDLAGSLISQFFIILQKAFKEFGGGLRNIDHVILTGGSARWPFIRGFLELSFDRNSIIVSKNPELTITKGLALARTGFRPPAPPVATIIEAPPPPIEPTVALPGAEQAPDSQITARVAALRKIVLQDDPSRSFSLDRATCRRKARERIRWYAGGGGVGAALVAQVPGIATAGLPVIEAKLVYDISQIYGYRLEQSQIITVVGGLVASGMVVKLTVMEVVGLVPVAGNLIKGGTAAAFILGLGEAAIKFFESHRFGSAGGAAKG